MRCTTATSATRVLSASGVRTATSTDKRGDGRGGSVRGWQARSSDFVVNVVCKVEDAGHHFVGGHEVVCAKGIDDALLGRKG
jgi:hypothetical protein